MHLIKKYFPEINEEQLNQFKLLYEALKDWNEKINVISRKDIEHSEERHFLHSLVIAKFITFKAGTNIIDVGTGGGFPGLPLAIMFPDCQFTLVDSIGKKIKVVNELASAAKLENINTFQARAETINKKFDFVISRAVTAFPNLYRWTKSMVSKNSENELKNGIISLKGGDLGPEVAGFGKRIQVMDLNQWYSEAWFESKKLVYLPIL